MDWDATWKSWAPTKPTSVMGTMACWCQLSPDVDGQTGVPTGVVNPTLLIIDGFPWA